MIDILGLMEPLAILVASVVLYIFVFQRKYKRNNGFYKNPDWTFVFKKWYAERQLNKIKLIKRGKLNEKFSKNISEHPLLLQNENSSDMISFYGTDQIGNSILLRMTRLRHRTADLWIMIRLNDITTKGDKYYTLPEHPITRIYEVTTGKFRAAGLEFECLEPFVRWRITYSGFLREKIRNEINNDDDIAESELKYVKFNFFFTGSNRPLFWPLDWSSKLMATGLATELWKDGGWPNILNVPGNGGYDQFGRLIGQIFLPNNECREICLPGLRQRRWEAYQNFNKRRFVSLFGVCNQGCIFNIGAISYKSALSHVQFGNVRFENDQVYPIDWTDFKIPSIAEEMKTIPQQYAIHFTAGGRSFKAFVRMELDKTIKLTNGFPYTEWQIANIPINFDLNITSGYGILTAWFPLNNSFITNEVKLSAPHRFSKLVFNSSLPDRNKFVVFFDENEAQSKLIAGGKGASLALLTTARNELRQLTAFEIPPGFIISSSALRQFLLTNSEIYLELRNLEDICSGKLNENLEDSCKRIKNLFKTSILDRDIGIAIRKSLETISNKHKDSCYAIRSSGVDEDGKEFSSAGQNETVLGVKGLDNILEAVKECWASLYSYRSVEYRRTHAQSIITDMAVVVQVMVPSECSGVLFTKHNSIAEHSSDILITANYGLGETVVSGSVEPDTFIISKNYNSIKFEIKETILGEKGFSLILKDSGDLEQIKNNRGNTACLSHEMLYNLAKIGVNLEKMYGDPQDIEWAIYNGNIYLLQSRPITTLKRFTDWEYLHEFDFAMMSENQILTKGNVGEVFVGAIDHLTASTIVKTFNFIWLKEKNNILEKLVGAKGTVTAYQQVFMEILTFFKGIKPGKVLPKEKVQTFGFLGSLELTSEIKMAGYHHNGPLTWSDAIEMAQIIFSSLFRIESKLKKLENIINHFRLIKVNDKINSFKTSQELLYEINVLIVKNLYEASEHHMFASIANSCLQAICLSTLLGNSDDFTADHINDLMKIMNASEGVISADIPKKIEEIANTIYLQSNAEEFKKLQVSEVPSWLEENCPVAHRQFNQFFRTFGHRCLNEFGLSSIPWETNTEYIIKVIQDNLKRNNLTAGHVHHETRSEMIIENLITPKKRTTKWFLKFLLPYCRRSVQNREKSKSLLIYFVNVLRKYFNRLSELMQNEGLLPQKNLVFFLTHYELQRLIHHGEIGLVQKAIRRHKLFDSWNKYKFPDVIFGNPQFSAVREQKEIKFDPGSKLKGIPAQNGTVEGRACVLTDISQINQIENGDILITYATDIAWSPVFPILGGLVTELGGLISHGAVVAREYGLPCIIGAKNATNCFKTGDKVYLDANSGFVTKL